MDRRHFLRQASVVAGAASLGSQNKNVRTVKYKIQGYTCITCAVGLEVLLRGLKGVTQATASYPDNNVIIGFDSKVVTEAILKEFIGTCGFAVNEG